MAWFVNALLIAAVAALAIVRQFRAGRVDTDGRWWVLPGILAFVALREPDLLGGDRHTASAAVLAADLLMGLALGRRLGLDHAHMGGDGRHRVE